jgi:hypothetical protein
MRWLDEALKGVTPEAVVAFGMALPQPAADEEVVGEVPDDIRPLMVAHHELGQVLGLLQNQKVSAEEAERVQWIAKQADLLGELFDAELRCHLDLVALNGMRIASLWRAVRKQLPAETQARIVLPTSREATMILATSRLASVVADAAHRRRKAWRREERTRIRA